MNNSSADEGYLLYFGRLSPEKGVNELLRAMVRLPHIPLVIAGDGPERARLEALAKELNLRQVLFAGMVHGEKLQKLIAGCSFSVFPSHAYETLGKSILESYAWGRPVIASRPGFAARTGATWRDRAALFRRRPRPTRAFHRISV